MVAVERAGPTGPIQMYHIMFAEDVSTTDTAAMPDRLAALATMLRLTFRFRWEVLEPYSRAPLSDEDIARVDVSMARIRADWESRGAIDPLALSDCFTAEQGLSEKGNVAGVSPSA